MHGLIAPSESVTSSRPHVERQQPSTSGPRANMLFSQGVAKETNEVARPESRATGLGEQKMGQSRYGMHRQRYTGVPGLIFDSQGQTRRIKYLNCDRFGFHRHVLGVGLGMVGRFWTKLPVL